jgi:two-component system LytT family response regulator
MNSKLIPTYNCVVIDDDQFFIDLISGYVNQITKLKILKSYTNPAVAIKEIDESDQIDFLFLDIRMDKISGIDVAKILRDKVRFIVFTTAYSEFALKAYEVGGDQYIVKPIYFKGFLDKINAVLKRNYAEEMSGLI